jgi:hypothetical protein
VPDFFNTIDRKRPFGRADRSAAQKSAQTGSCTKRNTVPPSQRQAKDKSKMCDLPHNPVRLASATRFHETAPIRVHPRPTVGPRQ